MPVFHISGKNVLFIHVPKTGGSTIERVLEQHGPMSFHNRLNRYCDQFAGGLLSKPIPMQHLQGKFLQRIFDHHHFDLIFTVVRDPVERLVSVYRHSRERGRVDAMLSFSQWLRLSLLARWADAGFRANHLRPQSEFLFGPCEVYHYEDGLPNIMAHVRERLGLDRIQSTPHHRASTPYPATVHPSDRQLIARCYASDYRLFPRYVETERENRAGSPSPAYLTGGA